jgi:hypothetical protein
VEHWNSGEGYPLNDRPQGEGVEWIAGRGQVCDPMKLDPKQDGQEQVVVELNSGRSYFVPREAFERLFRFCPAGAAALVARVSTLREPLDPFRLPSEAGLGGGVGLMVNRRKQG